MKRLLVAAAAALAVVAGVACAPPAAPKSPKPPVTQVPPTTHPQAPQPRGVAVISLYVLRDLYQVDTTAPPYWESLEQWWGVTVSQNWNGSDCLIEEVWYDDPAVTWFWGPSQPGSGEWDNLNPDASPQSQCSAIFGLALGEGLVIWA